MCIYISPICNVETRFIFRGNNKIRDSLFFSLHSYYESEDRCAAGASGKDRSRGRHASV